MEQSLGDLNAKMNDKLQRLTQVLQPASPSVSTAQTVQVPLTVEEPDAGEAPGLRDYWRIVHANRVLVYTAVVLGAALAAAYNYVRVPTYRATATLQIDREQPGAGQVGDRDYPEFPEAPDYLETQYKVLRSRTLAKQVVTGLGLERQPELAYSLTPEDLEAHINSIHPAVLEQFLERLAVRPSKGTRLVDVSYESVDPELAPRVVNTLAESFIQHNLQARWNATQKASVWLQEQLAELEDKLQASEAALQDYAAAHSILFVEERKDITTEKLAQLEEQLTRAEADRVEKQSLAMLVEDSVRREARLPGSLSSDAYRDLSAQLADLQREKSRLLVTFAPAYPSVRRTQREIESLDRAMRAEEERILSGVREEFEVAQQRERLLQASAITQRAKVNRISDDFIQYNILKRDAETNRELYEGLLQRLKEAGVAAGLRASNIAVLDPAEIPELPYRPRKLVNIGVGLLGGLALGVVFAFVREQLDTGVRTPEEVERLTGLPLLAVVPRTRDKRDDRKLVTRPVNDAESPGVVRWEPEQSLSEAYRTLRSSVLLGWDESMKRILLTSSQPQEGKTTLSLNLACSLAQLGRSVLVIDADMRRPDCSRQLGIEPGKGLSELLRGQAELDDSIRPTKIPGLSLLPSGESTSSASDLLYSPRLPAMLMEVGERFDHVIVDSPPSLALSDARTISRLVEGVVLVVSDKTERGSLSRVKQTLDEAGAPFLGFVMNRVNLDNLDYGHYRNYGYYYSYSDDAERKKRRSRKAAPEDRAA